MVTSARRTHRIARKGIESSQRLGRHRWTVERTLPGSLAVAASTAATNAKPNTSWPSPASPAPSSGTEDSPNEMTSKSNLISSLPSWSRAVCSTSSAPGQRPVAERGPPLLDPIRRDRWRGAVRPAPAARARLVRAAGAGVRATRRCLRASIPPSRRGRGGPGARPPHPAACVQELRLVIIHSRTVGGRPGRAGCPRRHPGPWRDPAGAASTGRSPRVETSHRPGTP